MPPCAQRACRMPFVQGQVHQLKQGTDFGCGLPIQFNITDITTYLAEPRFKATSRVLGELLKFSIANWLAFTLKY